MSQLWHISCIKCRWKGLVRFSLPHNPTQPLFVHLWAFVEISNWVICWACKRLKGCRHSIQSQNPPQESNSGVVLVLSDPLYLFCQLNMLIWVKMQVSGREQRSEHPHPLSDLTSSRWPSLFSGSVPEGGCWAMGLSDSASTSVTAAALGSDTSLQEEEIIKMRRKVWVGGRKKVFHSTDWELRFSLLRKILMSCSPNQRHSVQNDVQDKTEENTGKSQKKGAEIWITSVINNSPANGHPQSHTRLKLTPRHTLTADSMCVVFIWTCWVIIRKKKKKLNSANKSHFIVTMSQTSHSFITRFIIVF